jgi:hypothetical protein
VRFAFPEGLAERAGLSFAAGAPLAVEVALTAAGNYDRPPRSTSGRLYVETAEGKRVKRLSRLRSGEAKALRARLELPPGRYRLVVGGSARFGWFRARAFIVRSRPFDIVAAAPPSQGP